MEDRKCSGNILLSEYFCQDFALLKKLLWTKSVSFCPGKSEIAHWVPNCPTQASTSLDSGATHHFSTTDGRGRKKSRLVSINISPRALRNCGSDPARRLTASQKSESCS